MMADIANAQRPKTSTRGSLYAPTASSAARSVNGGGGGAAASSASANAASASSSHPSAAASSASTAHLHLPQRVRGNREAHEKAILAARREGHQRYSGDVSLTPAPTAAGQYMSDAERFHTDVAGEARRNRQAQCEKEQTRLVAMRSAELAREEKRWEGMSATQQAADDRLQRKRDSGLAAKKNAPSLPFNPITLEYTSTYNGDLLAHQDAMVKYRAALRTENLYNRQNNSHNPITGEERRNLAPPAKPQTPSR